MTPAPHGTASRHGVRPVWLLIGPALAASLGAFLLTVTVGPEWTAIQRDMGLSTSVSIWIFVAYLVPLVLAAPVGALLGWRWPTWRLPFMLAMPVGVVALLITAASGIVMLIQGASRPAQAG